ncbi:hypothetical protein CASFOL_014861 [Castilleja foliolosa]|uniref:Uncharacterized protein n=1 Tax=Castilleja foliolosa TaxID=1961234 RepID=A0ABD3DCH4_9LAMI
MDPTKSRGRERLSMCFKPAVEFDDGLVSDVDSSSSSSDDISSRRRKKRVRMSFCAAAKAAFFKTSLLKNLRGHENPNKQDLCRKSSNSLSSKSKRFVNSMKNFSYKSCWEPGQDQIDLPTDSSNSSLLSSDSTNHTASSSFSSHSSSSSSLPAESEPNQIVQSNDSIDFGNNTSGVDYMQKSMRRECVRKRVKKYKSTLEMSLLVVCLGSLIFLGKGFCHIDLHFNLAFVRSPPQKPPEG